jgi:hypothetical protein
MKLLRAIAAAGLAVSLTMVSQAAFAQSSQESGWAEAREVKQEISQARAQGIDVSQAQQYESQGRQALSNGDRDQASRYFEDAENALQDAGFQTAEANNEGTYNAETSNWRTSNRNYNQEASGNGSSQAREVRREINQARAQGIDVSDAQDYENRGRQELQNGNREMARNNFNKAETALDNAGFTGAQARNEGNYTSGNYNSQNYNESSGWNTGTSQSASSQAQALRRDIDQARSQGIDVSAAQDWARRGRQAQRNGDQQQALNDFNNARNSLNASGFQSSANTSTGGNWGNTSQWGTSSATSNWNTSNAANQPGWSQAHQVKRDINQAGAQGIDVSDAQYFAQRGRQALSNGDTNRAAAYFDKAENALQDAGFQSAQARNNPSNYGESYNQGNQSNYNQGNYNRNYNPSSYSGASASEQAQRLRNDIDQAQAQGINVNDAIYYENQAHDALRNGDEDTARKDFNMAENALVAGWIPGRSDR